MKKTDAKKPTPAQRIAVTGLLAALTLALSFAERALCAALPLPPGVRPGLSNVAVMFACASLGLPAAAALIAIKAGFVLLVSGVWAGALSLAGGALSVTVMWLLMRCGKGRFSYVGVSAVSAVMHNFGQLAAVTLLAGSAAYLWMAPVLLLSGVAFGAVTGLLLNAVLPSLLKILPYISDRTNGGT